MAGRNELRQGSERLRIGSWRGSERVGLVTPVGGLRSPSVELVHRACRELARRGYREVLTGALADDELAAFESCSFEQRDRLHLLAIDLRRSVPEAALPDGTELRRGRRGDRRRALEVDGRAFPAFWRLDVEGLHEALTATTDVRFQVACQSGGDRWRAGRSRRERSSLARPARRRVVGYAVTGLTGRMGYLQRLAVDPSAEGRGIGRALVRDGLRWLQDLGAVRAVVNTQVDNTRALGLYRSVGFELLPSGLVVLGRPLTPSTDLPATDAPATGDRPRRGQARADGDAWRAG